MNERVLGEEGSPQRMVFTGPDYVKDHKVTTHDDFSFVGEGSRSLEMTSDTSYLFRPSKDNVPPIHRKHQLPGSIGWSTSLGLWPNRKPSSKIIRGGFWTEAENNELHKIIRPSTTTTNPSSISTLIVKTTNHFGEEEGSAGDFV